MSPELRAELAALTKLLTDEGRLLEAGFFGFRMMAIPSNAPPVQIEFGRDAFMAGAHHLLASVLTFLDDGEEPTLADLRRMDLIGKELDAFRRELELRAATPAGTG